MFKKTLIAAALATTAFGAAASTVVSSGVTITVEKAAGVQQVAVANPIEVTIGRDYKAGDFIILTFTGATVATKTNASTPLDITPTVTGDLATNVEFLEYDVDAGQVIFNVTEPIELGVAATDTFSVDGIQLIVADAADEGTVKVAASGLIDTVAGPKAVDKSTGVTIVTFAQQISSKIATKFDGVVDVNAQRQKFEGGSTADTLVIENTIATADDAVTTTGATYTVYGDFSFLDVDGDGELEAKEGTVTSTAGTPVLADDFQSFTVTNATAIASGTVGFTVTAPADTVIPDQSFKASTVISYENPASASAADIAVTTLDKAAAGAWTLNGKKAHIPFLPFGSQYSQSVTVSNTSSQEGGVDLVIYVGGDTIEVEGVATVKAEGVTDLSSVIRKAVSDNGLSGNLSMDVIINAPESAVTVEALYYAKADGDRLRTL